MDWSRREELPEGHGPQQQDAEDLFRPASCNSLPSLKKNAEEQKGQKAGEMVNRRMSWGQPETQRAEDVEGESWR